MLSELKNAHITEVLLATVGGRNSSGCAAPLYLGQLQVL